MKKFGNEPYIQTVIGAFLSAMETPFGDGRLEETWLHDILSVTWARMERARKECEERAKDSLARMNQRKGTVLHKPIV